MFNLIRSRTLNHCRWVSSQITLKHESCFLQNNPLSSSSTSPCDKQSVIVSYLMKSCGLSQERALSASKRVSFETPKEPDSVLAFLKNCGFSDAQVSVFIRKYPRVLVCDPEKVLSPKLKFFQSIGFSMPEITSLLTKSQNLLMADLDTHIIPHFNLLNSFFSCQSETVFCIKRYPDILSRNFETRVADNIAIFRKAGASESSILTLFRRQPRSFLTSPDRVKYAVEELKKMEFIPHHTHFLNGAYVMIAMNRSIWEDKLQFFKKWGVSENEVRKAFRSNPWCMASSKEQIQRVMDFFVHEVGFDPLDVIKKPILFSLSFKATIVPRYSVYKVLLSKGLVKKQLTISIFKYGKRYFFEKFVDCHAKKAPELLKLVQDTS